MKRKIKTVTFTIFTNNVNSRIIQLRIPKFIIFIAIILVLSPIFFLLYDHQQQISIIEQQKNELNALTLKLQNETDNNQSLRKKVALYEENSDATTQYLKELFELEAEMRSYLDELPSIIQPSGGIEIDVSDLLLKNVFLEEQPIQYDSAMLIRRYKETLAKLDEAYTKYSHTPTGWPVPQNVITSQFGFRKDPFTNRTSYHSGIDIRGDYGTPVYATADGVVTLARYYGSYGNAIKISHSKTYTTLYGHLNSINVKVGQTVKKGKLIGTVGSTGRSTGPHLHYEVFKNGELTDPENYLNIFE